MLSSLKTIGQIVRSKPEKALEFLRRYYHIHPASTPLTEIANKDGDDWAGLMLATMSHTEDKCRDLGKIQDHEDISVEIKGTKHASSTVNGATCISFKLYKAIKETGKQTKRATLLSGHANADMTVTFTDKKLNFKLEEADVKRAQEEMQKKGV